MGYYSANYFNKTSLLIQKYKPNETVCIQFMHFSKAPVKVCGINETVQLLKNFLDKAALKKIQIYGVKDGDLVSGKKPVLLIFGPYQYFGKYENIIDGILARRSSVCNNCYQMLKLIKPDQLLFMADRTDDYLLQPYDGYSAYVGGVRHFVTQASTAFIKDPSVTVSGTIPHALIQQFDGDLTEAMQTYIKEFGANNAVALVDYHNDVIAEIKKIAKKIKNIYAIRIDTSNNMLDKSLQPKYRKCKNAYGVSPYLIKLARKTLDQCGMQRTKIVVSGGIDNQKIIKYLKAKCPIDFYGVGSNLIARNVHFTADLVLKNNRHEAKTGRKLFISINKVKTLTKYL